MEQKRVRSVLRHQFWFRIIVLFVAAMGCLGYFLYQTENSLLWGIVFGLSGSAFVWALVELFDFFIKTHHQYCVDRSNFFIMTNGYFLRIKDILRKDKVHIPWQEVQLIWNELWDRVAHFPFEGGVYSVSKEFSDAANYIEALYWKFIGCLGMAENGELKPGSQYEQMLHAAMISTEKETEGTSAYFFQMADLNWKELAEIEPTFEKIALPDGLINYGARGDLGEQFSIPGNIHTYITFRPGLDFEEKFHLEEPTGTFRTVLNLILSTDFLSAKLQAKLPTKQSLGYFFMLLVGVGLVIPSFLKEVGIYTSWPWPGVSQELGTLLIAVILEKNLKRLFKKAPIERLSNKTLTKSATILTIISAIIEQFGSACLRAFNIYFYGILLGMWLLAVDYWCEEKRASNSIKK